MRVLVVEDDESIRETLGLVLGAFGFDTELVEDGEEALGSLEKHWPDVVLLDLTLPGLSGDEVFREIERRYSHTPPIVVLSAAAEGGERTNLLSGAIFLAKPFTIEELQQAIELATRTKAA